MGIVVILIAIAVIAYITRAKRQVAETIDPVDNLDFQFHKARQKIKRCSQVHELEIEFGQQRKALLRYRGNGRYDPFKAAMGQLWADYYNKLMSFQAWNK
jgi:hypothetical protein